MSDSEGIKSVLQEDRLFPPPSDFSSEIGGAWIDSMKDYQAQWQRSIDDPDGFWAEVAREYHWFKPFSSVLEWDCPDAKWFSDGTTNMCFNCVDRQVHDGFGDDPAIIWEGEPMEDGRRLRPPRLHSPNKCRLGRQIPINVTTTS